MRLLTHNVLACLRCEQFPLEVVGPSNEPEGDDSNEEGTGSSPQVELIPGNFDELFTRRMLQRMDYPILLKGIETYRAGFRASLPADRDDLAAALVHVVAADAEVELTVRELIETPLPPTLEDLGAALVISPSDLAATAAQTERTSGFATQDPEQQKLLLLLHVLLEGLAVRRGALLCPACQTRFPIEEFIPSFVTVS